MNRIHRLTCLFSATEFAAMRCLRSYHCPLTAIAPLIVLFALGSTTYFTNNCFDAKDEPIMQTIKDYRLPVMCVVFSPDGKTLATGGGPWEGPESTPNHGGPSEIKLWDLTTGKEIASLKGHSSWVFALAFSKDKKFFISAGTEVSWPGRKGAPQIWGEIRFWDLIKSKEAGLIRAHSNQISCLAFSPDDKLIASGSWDQTVKIWDSTEMKELVVIEAHDGILTGLVFKPDSKGIITVGGRDKEIRFWDVPSGKRAGAIKNQHADNITSLAISPKMPVFATGDKQGGIKVFELNSLKLVGSMQGHKGATRSLGFSTNGKLLASGGEDGKVIVWDTKEYKRLESFNFDKRGSLVFSVAFSPDSALLASSAAEMKKAGQVKLWKITEPEGQEK